jgi:formylglycine-generating enzyme required for sulfatase activity
MPFTKGCRSYASVSAIVFGLIAFEATCPGIANELREPIVLMLPLRLSYPEERALKPKDRFKECSDCPEMVVVPAGDFIMGSPANEEGRSGNEEPQHLVTIAHPFAVGRYAVTFDEWDACVADGGCRGYRPNDRGWGRGRRPVIGIRWDDANAYVVWLSQKTSRPYRLPSEAEREYVTRAGTTTSFWMGASISSHDANYDGEFAFGGGPKGEFRKKTVPVDSFEPNPWGLYQMMGNIYEWTEDCYHKTYDGAPTDGSAWISGDCNRMVFRGGAWLFAPWHLRAASRGSVAGESSHVVGGLRVARSLVQERFSGNQ